MRFGYKSPKGGPRRIISLAGQSKCPKLWSVIQGNITGCPIDKDHVMKVQDKGEL